MAVTTTAIMREHLKEIIHQAKQIALLEAEKERYEKLANVWEERALKAEQCQSEEYNAAVVHANKLVCEKHDLKERLEMAESLLQRIHDFLAYNNVYRIGPGPSMVQMDGDKALDLATEITAFVHPEQREEVAANGR